MTPSTVLAARLESLAQLAEEALLDPAFHEALREARDLAAGLDPYVQASTTPESDVLAELARCTIEAAWDTGAGGLEAEMLSGHVEGRLLAFLVGAARVRRVLEIGMFTGYSALAMAEALPDDGHLVACELDPRAAAMAQSAFDRSAHGAKIEVRLGDARDLLERLAAEGQQFDLVFVDADKTGYVGYFSQLLDRNLLAPGGVIAVDNTLMQGLPWTDPSATEAGSAITAFNRIVADDPRVEQVLVPVRDGLTLIRRV